MTTVGFLSIILVLGGKVKETATNCVKVYYWYWQFWTPPTVSCHIIAVDWINCIGTMVVMMMVCSTHGWGGRRHMGWHQWQQQGSAAGNWQQQQSKQRMAKCNTGELHSAHCTVK